MDLLEVVEKGAFALWALVVLVAVGEIKKLRTGLLDNKNKNTQCPYCGKYSDEHLIP